MMLKLENFASSNLQNNLALLEEILVVTPYTPPNHYH